MIARTKNRRKKSSISERSLKGCLIALNAHFQVKLQLIQVWTNYHLIYRKSIWKGFNSIALQKAIINLEGNQFRNPTNYRVSFSSSNSSKKYIILKKTQNKFSNIFVYWANFLQFISIMLLLIWFWMSSLQIFLFEVGSDGYLSFSNALRSREGKSWF
jgi:hypothetical protein